MDVAYDPYSDEAMYDPQGLYAQLRRHDPVHFMPAYNAWALASFDAAMREQWALARAESLPSNGPGAQDRRVLFAAVARGVLQYLYAHRDELLSTLQQPEGTGNHRHQADFDLVEKP